MVENDELRTAVQMITHRPNALVFYGWILWNKSNAIYRNFSQKSSSWQLHNWFSNFKLLKFRYIWRQDIPYFPKICVPLYWPQFIWAEKFGQKIWTHLSDRKFGHKFRQQDLRPQIFVCKRQLYFPSQASFSFKKQRILDYIMVQFSTSRKLEL